MSQKTQGLAAREAGLVSKSGSALESVIPVPLEASVNICSKIVLFFL